MHFYSKQKNEKKLYCKIALEEINWLEIIGRKSKQTIFENNTRFWIKNIKQPTNLNRNKYKQLKIF